MKSIIYAVLILLVGALLGDFLGKLIVIWFPTGAMRELFATHLTTGLNPATFDVGILSLTFGCMFKFNVTAIVGIVVAAIMAKMLFK